MPVFSVWFAEKGFISHCCSLLPQRLLAWTAAGKLQQSAKLYLLRGSWIEMFTLRAKVGLSCSYRCLVRFVFLDLLDRS